MLMASPLLFLALSILSLSVPSSSSENVDALTLLSLLPSLTSTSVATSSPLPTWNPSNVHSFCSSWQGVACDSSHHVISLNLSGMNLSGTVSTHINQLRYLSNLSLSGNSLHGHLHLTHMPSLRHLNISGNQFSGSIDHWVNLPNLQILDAYDNNFTSTLPSTLPNSTHLRYLDLGGNFFYGAIPYNYGTFPSIEFLSLAGNDLRGSIPASLANLSSSGTIRELVLGYYNRFSGYLPPELGQLSTLRHLDASSCGLRGTIPTSLGGLRSLLSLFLHTNSLSGPIPPSLANLTYLTHLDLSNNALTGELPPELSHLRHLTLLNLFMNQIHGPIPQFVAELRDLHTLGLFMNNFTGEIPKKLGTNAAIESVDLSSNRLTGTIPEDICCGQKLKVLILLKNFLFGDLPRGLGWCATLVRVRLGGNYLNGTVPPGFIYLPELDLAELQDNYLSGALAENPRPAERSRLALLNLSNNLLSGQLPSSLSDLSSLQTLALRGNQISGPIPGSIVSVRRLVKLDLSSNAISGSIPLELTQCSKLTYLDLSGNELAGSIPPEISNIAMLNYLNLSRNHLNGSVPTTIGAMASLTSADLSFNDLSGTVPTTGHFVFFNASAFAGNPKLCGFAGASICGEVAKVGTSSATRSRDAVKVSTGDWRIILALSIFLSCLAFAAAWAVRARSIRGGEGDPLTSEWKMTAFCKVEFTTDDVVGCMKDCNVIGRGGAGVVYLCRIPGRGEVAVKKLMVGFGKRSGGACDDGGYDHGFKAEVRTLGGIRHRNIVRLLAFCSNGRTNLLVYEYMRNGSLGTSLHGDGKKPTTSTPLLWERRYGIALEAARGLCYLHHDCSPMIVHRDVKSNNILLDSKLEAHVADFGLAKFMRNGGASECMSAIAGSYGYIAPEYAYTLKVDEKSDVYSYGVVLLELLTGRRPVGEFGEGVDIVHWAKTTTGSRGENANRILDTRLTRVPKEEASHVFFIAMLCVQEDSVQRPTMREVIQMLSEFPRPDGDDHPS